MATGFRKYVPALLLSAFVVTAACSDDNLVVGPTTTAGFQGPVGPLVTVEPATTRAEFLSHPACPVSPPFQLQLVLTLSSRVVGARHLEFQFTDRFGRRAVPLAFPLLTQATVSRPLPSSTPLPTPTSSPIPIPSAPAIPVPGAPRIEEVLLSFRRLPFMLEFECGVPAVGTLVARVETTDEAGRSRTSHVTVRVGGSGE